MTPDEIRLYAKLSAHEFLIEQIFAMLIVNDPSPRETARSMGDRLRVLASRGYERDGEASEDVDALLNETAAQLSHFWTKVTSRVEDELSRGR